MKKIIMVILLSIFMTGCNQDVEKMGDLNKINKELVETINEQANSIENMQARLDEAEKRISEFESNNNEGKVSELPKSISDYYVATSDIAADFIKAYAESDIDTMKQYVADYISISQEGIIIDLSKLELYGLPPKEVKKMQIPSVSGGSEYVFERFVYDERNNMQYYEYGFGDDPKQYIDCDIRIRINAQGVVTYIDFIEHGI